MDRNNRGSFVSINLTSLQELNKTSVNASKFNKIFVNENVMEKEKRDRGLGKMFSLLSPEG